MDNVSNRVASLSPDERASLVMKLKRKARGAEKAVDHTIHRRKNTIDAPLSLAQQRLWFLHQLDPANDPYYLPFYHRLTGPLDVTALEHSLNEIIRRHEILRTVFKEKNSEVVQVVLPSLDLTLPLFDLSELPKRAADMEIKLLVDSQSARPFNLEQGPLLRAILLRRSEEEHGFLLVVHHIVMDGWSMDIFMGELVALYEAFSANQPSPLAELPLQYADFAAWQREWIKKGVLAEQLAYWKKQLNGDLPMLEVPTDHPRPPRMTYHGADGDFDLKQDLIEQLNELSQREGATLYMTLMAALLTLLHRYTGQDDIVLGTATAGRNHAEIEKLIGFFINTLVLRTDLSGNPSFRELLGRVREVALGAYEHQDVPFEKLVEELQPERDASRQPFFQVMVNFQTAPAYELIAGEVKISPQDVGDQTRFDLELHLWVVPQGVTGNLIYNTDLFEQSTIARMLKHFETLLKGIAANPAARLSELPLLTEEEQEQFRAWNATSSEYGRDQCLQPLVEMQAARQPDVVAVSYGAEEISYGELNTRANQLAHYLRRRGVGPDVRVGVLLDRSVDLIVALLGIVKAGGAYVPLDGDYPAQRLRFMLEDAGAALLLTKRGQPEVIAEGKATEVVYLDEQWEQLGSERRENPEIVTTAENLVYVMYTSGSTGRPKGVAIEHHSVVTLLYWARETFSAEELQGVLAATSICFDLSVFELFVPLSWGGRVILAENALALPQLVAREEVRLVNTVPSVISELVRLGGIPGGVRVVNLAGEALRRPVVDQIYEQETIKRVINLYGPSEDTTYSTWAEMKRGEEGRVVIGRPLANTRAYVVDGQGMVVPVGVAGELWLGGDGLARGYLQRAELTAEKFVPDGLSGRSGERLYRTGDLVRYLSDGNIEFLKRMDQQVKIRGFRIELGEIEAALEDHAAVRESIVTAREEIPGDKQLVAYVVRDSNLEPEQLIPELRNWLRARMPAYMMPATFVVLDELPLNANGKIDRRALPVPDRVRYSAEEFIAPRTSEEEKIAEIWSEVLGVRPISVEANFFELGGHSLLATRVISRIRETCGVDLPLRLLFDSPTIAALATHVKTDLSHISGLLETLASLSEDETKTLLGNKEAQKAQNI